MKLLKYLQQKYYDFEDWLEGKSYKKSLSEINFKVDVPMPKETKVPPVIQKTVELLNKGARTPASFQTLYPHSLLHDHNNCKVLFEDENLGKITAHQVKNSVNLLGKVCYGNAFKAGWWTDIETGEPLKRNIPEMLMLIVTEIAEAMEGYRKNLMDDHLPQHSMLGVELADAIIRIMDLGPGLGLDLGTMVAEKIIYNQTRADHKIENRKKPGGKKI